MNEEAQVMAFMKNFADEIDGVPNVPAIGTPNEVKIAIGFPPLPHLLPDGSEPIILSQEVDKPVISAEEVALKNTPKQEYTRRQIKEIRRAWRILHPVTPVAVRITRRNKFEVRLSNKEERVYKHWQSMCDAIGFPVAYQPDLFNVLAAMKGEWVDFTEDEEEETL